MDAIDPLQRAIDAARKCNGRLARPKRLGEVILPLVPRLTKEAIELDRIEKAWAAAVPQGLQEGCELVGIEDGCLCIKVRDLSYRYELGLRQEELVRAVRSQPGCGRIRRIRIVLENR